MAVNYATMKMEKIIEVQPVTKDYLSCNVCHSDKEVKELNFGSRDITGNTNTISIRLCEECLTELRSKL